MKAHKNYPNHPKVRQVSSQHSNQGSRTLRNTRNAQKRRFQPGQENYYFDLNSNDYFKYSNEEMKKKHLRFKPETVYKRKIQNELSAAKAKEKRRQKREEGPCSYYFSTVKPEKTPRGLDLKFSASQKKRAFLDPDLKIRDNGKLASKLGYMKAARSAVSLLESKADAEAQRRKVRVDFSKKNRSSSRKVIGKVRRKNQEVSKQLKERLSILSQKFGKLKKVGFEDVKNGLAAGVGQKAGACKPRGSYFGERRTEVEVSPQRMVRRKNSDFGQKLSENRGAEHLLSQRRLPRVFSASHNFNRGDKSAEKGSFRKLFRIAKESLKPNLEPNDNQNTIIRRSYSPNKPLFRTLPGFSEFKKEGFSGKRRLSQWPREAAQGHRSCDKLDFKSIRRKIGLQKQSWIFKTHDAMKEQQTLNHWGPAGGTFGGSSSTPYLFRTQPAGGEHQRQDEEERIQTEDEVIIQEIENNIQDSKEVNEGLEEDEEVEVEIQRAEDQKNDNFLEYRSDFGEELDYSEILSENGGGGVHPHKDEESIQRQPLAVEKLVILEPLATRLEASRKKKNGKKKPKKKKRDKKEKRKEDRRQRKHKNDPKIEDLRQRASILDYRSLATLDAYQLSSLCDLEIGEVSELQLCYLKRKIDQKLKGIKQKKQRFKTQNTDAQGIEDMNEVRTNRKKGKTNHKSTRRSSKKTKKLKFKIEDPGPKTSKVEYYYNNYYNRKRAGDVVYQGEPNYRKKSQNDDFNFRATITQRRDSRANQRRSIKINIYERGTEADERHLNRLDDDSTVIVQKEKKVKKESFGRDEHSLTTFNPLGEPINDSRLMYKPKESILDEIEPGIKPTKKPQNMDENGARRGQGGDEKLEKVQNHPSHQKNNLSSIFKVNLSPEVDQLILDKIDKKFELSQQDSLQVSDPMLEEFDKESKLIFPVKKKFKIDFCEEAENEAKIDFRTFKRQESESLVPSGEQYQPELPLSRYMSEEASGNDFGGRSGGQEQDNTLDSTVRLINTKIHQMEKEIRGKYY